VKNIMHYTGQKSDFSLKVPWHGFILLF